MAHLLGNFEGKVTIMKGRGSVIGEAVAREIAGRGGFVVVADVNPAGAGRDLGTFEAITALVASLASERASFMTGRCHLVDGGTTSEQQSGTK